jgi:hypothetical protein
VRLRRVARRGCGHFEKQRSDDGRILSKVNAGRTMTAAASGVNPYKDMGARLWPG